MSFWNSSIASFGLARHEIAFAQRGVQIGSLRGNFQARFEQRNRIFKIVLRHADASHQEDHVGVLGRQLVSAHQQIESVRRPRLFGINLSQEIESFRRLGLQLQCAVQGDVGFRVFMSAEIGLSEVMENLKRFRLQSVGLFQFELRRFVLLRGGEQHAEREVQLHILLVRR